MPNELHARTSFFVSSPDNHGDTSSRLPARDSNAFTILQRVHCLGCPRRQSKFAHGAFPRRGSPSISKIDRYPEFTMDSTRLKNMTSDSLPSLLVLKRPMLFNSRTSSRNIIASWSPTAQKSSPCTKIRQSSDSSSDSLWNSACPVLLSVSWMLGRHDSEHCIDATRIQHTSRIDSHLRLLLWRQGSTPVQFGSRLLVRDHHVLILCLRLQSRLFQVYDPVVHALPMSASCHIPGNKKLRPVVRVQVFLGLRSGFARPIEGVVALPRSSTLQGVHRVLSNSLQLRHDQWWNLRTGEAVKLSCEVRRPLPVFCTAS